MSKHTPGPWEVQTEGCYPVVRKVFRADHHMNVCGPVHGYMYADDEKANQQANARLIAAAPELLAALQDIVRSVALNQCAMNLGLESAALVAIAKATGAAA